MFACLKIQAPCACFNSKLVRLKEKSERAERASKYPFQFQTGSIKREPESVRLAKIRAFQFQTGSIKSEPRGIAAPPTADTFQFQTGSIKSLFALSCSLFLLCFNSKLVRLKVKEDFIDGLINEVSIPNWFD